MAEAIVMYPWPMASHIIPFVKLAHFILSRRPSFSIIILIPPHRIDSNSTPVINSYIAHISATQPSIQFRHLPHEIPPPPPTGLGPPGFTALRRSNPSLRQALEEISKSYTIVSFVVDYLCTCALSVSSPLNLPAYFFFPSPAGCLAFFIYLPTLHRSTTKSFKELGTTLLNVPGIPPVPARDSPRSLLDRHFEAYSYFYEFSENFPRSLGIFVNSFEALESRTLRAIREGQCLPDHPTPPLFCIGPLVASNDSLAEPSSDHECLRWLDRQAPKSVVYLSFGTVGVFSKEQLKEIAVGLERSEQPFLWVIRAPPSEMGLEVESVLPEDFIKRVGDRGFLVKSWAPQVAILEHPAVGGFVTHCGWNSILEAVRAGVPMVAWPLYAEQHLNRVLLVEDMKISLWMEEDDNGFVGREEVEKQTRAITDNITGDVLRLRSETMKLAARDALTADGSSVADLDSFLTLLCSRKS